MIERIPYNIKFGSGVGMRIWAKMWAKMWATMSIEEREVFMKYYKEVLEELRIDYYIDGDIQV